MALSDEFGSNMVMPVAPMGGGYGNGNGFGGFGGDGGWWILLLFILLAGGNGWGNGFGNGNAAPYVAAAGADYAIQNGFDQAALTAGITGVQNAVTAGFGDVQTALCGGFASVNAGVANGFAQAEIANNSRQIANMQQAFASQTAVTSGLTSLSAQLANCCCENRAATQDVKYTIANEASATRAANAANTQAILDKMCQLELDGYKRENDQLRNQLQFANMQASQVAQTAELRTAAQTANANLLTELRNCPIPAQAVYGNQPVFTCGAQSSCGCSGSF